MPTLLRDVFDIPEKVDASDFVLQLVKGVEASDRTLREYVVTPALAKAFDDALGLVERTLAGGTSKGAFVHGSFGSGKSHFMAVLHLLLSGNTAARALAGLQAVVSERSRALNAKLLTLDYHLLGKESFESALFDGYLSTVARLHPEATPPVLHQTDKLLADAANLRTVMGDEAFLAGLGVGTAASSGWGTRASSWNPETYEAAAAAPVGDAHRNALVTALTATYFTGYTSAGQWLETADGLQAMTAHAKSLGYDGIVLFLDELVLWLAQHLGDSTFIQREASKVARLVEAGNLPLPIVSFVARQRDLKDFLGGTMPGAEQEAVGDSFRWWEERFERIELAAADLPQIVHRRLLMPTSASGADEVRRAVARVQGDAAAWTYLLTDMNGSDGDDFALTYPFSPALVDAMVALSALMQRERTALRLMGELLSAGRDELTVDDVIPVGDLFDVAVLGGVEPLTADMKKLFANAAQFYEAKMRPFLLASHGLTPEQVETLPRSHPFVTEDRLVKTLLLAALAGGAPSLRNLTFAKLAALNYGTVMSFVPGQEAMAVKGLVTRWAAEFGEVHVGDGENPVVSLTLTGVDYDTLIEAVQHEDRTEARRDMLRRTLMAELEVRQEPGLETAWSTTVLWRGSRRPVDVVFGNVRDSAELSDQALRAAAGRWKVVIDFPFDSGDHSAIEDVNRVQGLLADGEQSATLVWLPHFLSAPRMDDVGRLVLLEYLLMGDRFDLNAARLSPGDREPARQQLDNQRRNLRARLADVLKQAYGVAPATTENVDVHIAQSQVYSTLLPGVAIAPPVAATLRQALDGALRQGLDAQYPQHPQLESPDAEIKTADLRTVLELARAAVDAGGRLDGIERTRAAVLRRVANPLGCGVARETVYALGPDTFRWLADFTRWNADADAGGVLVRDLRVRLQPYGLVDEVADLLIAVWAALEDREWMRGGVPVPAPGIGQLSGDITLRPARLPDADEWQRARTAAQALFGVPGAPRRSAAGVTTMARGVRDAVGRLRTPASDLVSALRAQSPLLGLDETSPRLATALDGNGLLARLAAEREDTVLLQVLASFDLPAEPQALAKSLSSAAAVSDALRAADWEMLTRALGVPGGESIAATLASAAANEELHAPLAPALSAAGRAARDLLLPPAVPAPTPGPADDETTPTPPTDVDSIVLDFEHGGTIEQAIDKIRSAGQTARASGRKLVVTWTYQ
ncbi:hypothetical protein [Cellulomonas sp. HZM]|uniref:hypothetical protein n=1 Tax=Cellulomonas sp. HZM TaxID=1454010 RepID=UPI00068B0D10|nr:hypothetical protein [Cellulomonas sp. HZM]